MSNGSEDNPNVCDHCQFTLRCGCRYDDHDYKLEECEYYALYHRYQRLWQELRRYIDKYEGGNNL